MENKLTKKQKELLVDFVELFIKISLQRNKKFNFYEKQLIEIIEEYEHYINYKKEWKERVD